MGQRIEHVFHVEQMGSCVLLTFLILTRAQPYQGLRSLILRCKGTFTNGVKDKCSPLFVFYSQNNFHNHKGNNTKTCKTILSFFFSFYVAYSHHDSFQVWMKKMNMNYRSTAFSPFPTTLLNVTSGICWVEPSKVVNVLIFKDIFMGV